MTKKLVWSGIFILVIVLMILPIVKAYTAGFERSGLICSGLTALDDGKDFSNDFFNHYANGVMTVGDDPSSFGYNTASSTFTSSSTHYTGMNLIYYTHIANNAGQCYGNWFDSTDKQGMYLYGYLYLIDPVTYITIDLTSYINDQKSYCTGGGIMFYDLSTVPSSLGKSAAFESALRLMSPTPVYPNGATDVCDTSATQSSWNGRNVQSYNPTITLLQPGLYFVTVGIVSHSGGSNIQTEKRAGGGIAFKFNDVDNTGSFVTASTNSPRFNIVTDRLSSTDLNTLYGASIENTSWLCKVAGGMQMNLISSVDPETAAGIKILTDNNLSYNHICCGDDNDESLSTATPIDFNYTIGTTTITYMCSGGQWAQGDVVSTCKALVEPANGVAGDVYESGFNVKKSPYFLIQTIPNGSDGCCGDDLSVKGLYATGADYGYFDSSNKGMCYANISDLSAPETAVWNWKRASQTKSFEIWPLYLNNSKTVDVISNGDEWYYCNANSNFSKGLTANVLNETQQPIPKGGDNTIACADVMNTLYSKININGAPIMFTSNESCGPSTAPCCGYTDPQTQSFNVGLDKMSDCADYCYVNGATVSFDLSGQSGVGGWNCVKNDPVKDWLCPQDSGSGTANPGTQDDPTTTVCHSYDTSGCIGTIITKDHLCSELGGIDCASNNNICSLGTLVGSSDSSECCYSAIRSTKCLPKRDINSAVDCVTNFSGIAYNTTTEICNGEEQSILNNNLRCCFNTKSTKNLGISKLFASTIKTSLPNIMCYKDSTGNYLAECIYDDWSVNMKFVPGGKLIDASNGRLMSIGSSIHTIMSFDIIINRSVVDRQKNLSLLQTGNYLSLPQNQWIATQQPKPIKPYDLSKYDYLEFDVSYPTLTCQLTVVLAYNTLAGTSLTKTFSLCPYLTQGDRSYRWNHVKINLTELGFMKGDIYDYLIFRDYTPSTQQYNILLDNIKVSSNDNSINTPSEYCTGGYGKWLNNLDPNSSITDYNPYAAACNAQESYGWTGTMCCGDDTGYNYGEFYNDTVSGCFNGSIIDNDRTVSYASGVRETGINFDSYIFKGLLYYNNSFIGCQVDTSSSPFSTLVRSKDGKVYYPNNDLIVSQIYSNQCSVVGSYYCSNSAWRKLIKVSNTSYTDFNGKEMYLKTVPAGVELIKNGFRGTN